MLVVGKIVQRDNTTRKRRFRVILIDLNREQVPHQPKTEQPPIILPAEHLNFHFANSKSQQAEILKYNSLNLSDICVFIAQSKLLDIGNQLNERSGDEEVNIL